MEHTSPMGYSNHLKVHDHLIFYTQFWVKLNRTQMIIIWTCPHIHWPWCYHASGSSTGWVQPVVCISRSLHSRILMAVQTEGCADSMPFLHDFQYKLKWAASCSKTLLEESCSHTVRLVTVHDLECSCWSMQVPKRMSSRIAEVS
jgi:hypothetical protein